jgi:hypothetical protein
MADLVHNIQVVQAVAPAVHTATKSDAAVIDLQGAGSATVIVNTGAIAGDGDFTASLAHGDKADLSDSAAVTDDDLLDTLPASLDANKTYAVGYRGGKRYVRVVLTKNGGTSIAAGAVVIKGHLALAGAA